MTLALGSCRAGMAWKMTKSRKWGKMENQMENSPQLDRGEKWPIIDIRRGFPFLLHFGPLAFFASVQLGAVSVWFFSWLWAAKPLNGFFLKKFLFFCLFHGPHQALFTPALVCHPLFGIWVMSLLNLIAPSPLFGMFAVCGAFHYKCDMCCWVHLTPYSNQSWSVRDSRMSKSHCCSRWSWEQRSILRKASVFLCLKFPAAQTR